MMWVLLIIGGLMGGLASGGLTYTAMIARENVVVKGAIAAERRAGVVKCNARVAEIETVHNRAVSEAVDDAVRAVGSLAPTPDEREAIAALCAKSASCRSRAP